MTIQQTTDRIPDGFGFIISFNQHRKEPGDPNRPFWSIDPPCPFHQLGKVLED
jgi:hypothetical protein